MQMIAMIIFLLYMLQTSIKKLFITLCTAHRCVLYAVQCNNRLRNNLEWVWQESILLYTISLCVTIDIVRQGRCRWTQKTYCHSRNHHNSHHYHNKCNRYLQTCIETNTSLMCVNIIITVTNRKRLARYTTML